MALDDMDRLAPAPGSELEVYWHREADLPAAQADPRTGRPPVAHVGIAYDGDGWLLVLFGAAWEERSDFWFETEALAEEEAAFYGADPGAWRATGATPARPVIRAV